MDIVLSVFSSIHPASSLVCLHTAQVTNNPFFISSPPHHFSLLHFYTSTLLHFYTFPTINNNNKIHSVTTFFA
ncbi:hypothetical protein EYC84_009577 [Monilinia fructicola]|uniref:Uncharacterized protein n=1 Tax=Monilinia fructicola TaxID=38448 RepID=A0A5M9J927_MONFR|nr:hypothetical protein EYC84_009577 [Monilinia fructicola]